jgi:hypothetical protein
MNLVAMTTESVGEIRKIAPDLSNSPIPPDVSAQPTTRPRRPAMRYMLLLRYPEGAGPQEGTPELDAEMAEWGALNEELKASGNVITAAGLQPETAATTVRTPDGEAVLTDGPFAESKELLFSFYVVDLPDLDAATALAARMPSARYGSVEVRPITFMEET